METKLDSMYQLAKTFETALNLVDEDWVLTDEALTIITKTEMDITQKTENIFKVLRFLESQVEMMTEEKNYINWKQRVVKNNIERIRKLLSLWLDTIWASMDKEWKKSQSIKTLKWTVFYKFSENVEYKKEEIAPEYIIKKTKLRMSESFNFERIKEIAPEMVEEVEIEEIDYEKLRFDYDRAKRDWKELPKWIIITEDKSLNVRK